MVSSQTVTAGRQAGTGSARARARQTPLKPSLPAELLNNPNREGLYRMSPYQGNDTVMVPYSRVQDARNFGYSLDPVEVNRWVKDVNDAREMNPQTPHTEVKRFARAASNAAGVPALTHAIQHPWDTVTGLPASMVNGLQDQWDDTASHLQQARSYADDQAYGGAAVEGVRALPFFGSLLSNEMDAYDKRDYARMFGTAAGTVGGILAADGLGRAGSAVLRDYAPSFMEESVGLKPTPNGSVGNAMLKETDSLRPLSWSPRGVASQIESNVGLGETTADTADLQPVVDQVGKINNRPGIFRQFGQTLADNLPANPFNPLGLGRAMLQSGLETMSTNPAIPLAAGRIGQALQPIARVASYAGPLSRPLVDLKSREMTQDSGPLFWVSQ